MKKILDLSKEYQQEDKTPVRNLHFLPPPVLGAWPLRGQAYVNGAWVDRCWYPDGSHMKESKRLIPLVKTAEFDPSLAYETLDGTPVKIYEVYGGRLYYRENYIATSIAVENWGKNLRIKQPLKVGSLCMEVYEGNTYYGLYEGFDFEEQKHMLRHGRIVMCFPKVRPVTHEDLDKWNT